MGVFKRGSLLKCPFEDIFAPCKWPSWNSGGGATSKGRGGDGRKKVHGKGTGEGKERKKNVQPPSN